MEMVLLADVASPGALPCLNYDDTGDVERAEHSITSYNTSSGL